MLATTTWNKKGHMHFTREKTNGAVLFLSLFIPFFSFGYFKREKWGNIY